MNEEMREEFENFCERESIDPVNMLFSDGGYVDGEIDLAWKSWQASREAMKPIKLPLISDFKSIDVQWNDETETETVIDILFEDDYQSAVTEAIESAGYKVAP